MKDLFGRDKVREAIERIRMFEPAVWEQVQVEYLSPEKVKQAVEQVKRSWDSIKLYKSWPPCFRGGRT